MKLIIILGVLLIISCATSYRESYVDTQLSKTLYKVFVSGSGFSSKSEVVDYALLRAAELTLDKGYKYFIIANRNQDKTTDLVQFGSNSSYNYGYINPTVNFNSATNYSSPTYTVVHKYSNEIVFEMLHETIKKAFIYDAEIIYTTLSKRYKLLTKEEAQIAEEKVKQAKV